MHRCSEVEALRVVVLVLREEELRSAERGLVDGVHQGARGIIEDGKENMRMCCGWFGVYTGVQGKKGITWQIAK